MDSLACIKCGNPTDAMTGKLIRPAKKKAAPLPLCGTCASAVEASYDAETLDPKLSSAALYGIGAAVISALLWYAVVMVTNYQVGIAAVVVGWLVSVAVMYGAGRKRGPRVQALSVGLTLFAMALAEYSIVRSAVVEELAKNGSADVPLILPIDLVIEFIAAGLKSDPITLLFWAIAVWEAIWLPRKRRLARFPVKGSLSSR